MYYLIFCFKISFCFSVLNHKNMKERMISRVISKHDLTNTVGCDAGDNNIPIIPKNVRNDILLFSLII